MSARTSSSHGSKIKFPPGEYTIHKPSQCKQLLKNRPIHLKRCTFEGKEVTKVIEKEGFRKLLVPSKEPTVYPTIITSTEFKGIQERSHNPTREEIEKRLARAEQEKTRLMQESMKRKEIIRHMDLKRNREKLGRLSEIEEEARQRTMHLLERAEALQLEQEEEIKKCNKIILETKCRAIRDAQLAEKKLLEREMEIEERRVNELMEQERVQALRLEEEKERELATRQHQYSQVLKNQIRQNEEERLIEYERKREESKLINMNSIAQQEAELEKLKERDLEKQRARRELLECNEQLKHFRAMEREENRIMDLRIQEFNREKAEREARMAEEIRQENLRKEREKKHLAEQALQAQGLQAQIDELNAQRVSEEVEREWRRREKEKALQRAESLQQLRESREAQINNKIKLQAMEIERERIEFEKILALQKEAVCRDEKEREKKRRQALVHRSEILRQVNEKEKQRIVARQKMFEEGLAIRAQNEQRKKRLRDVMERKCHEMEDNRVPDMYIKEVKAMIEHID